MRVAIILYGYLRTWNICKTNIINTFSENFNDVDWYLELWNTKTASKDEIIDFFASSNQKIVNFDFVDSKKNYLYEKWYNTWWKSFGGKFSARHNAATIGPGYLKQLGSYKKRLYEFKNNVKYDLVFYIRPDVVYYKVSRWQFTKSQIDVLHKNFGYSGDLNLTHNDMRILTNDVCQIGGTFASDIIGYFYLDNNNDINNLVDYPYNAGFDVHGEAGYYLLSHKLNRFPFIFWKYKSRIVRPSVDLEKLEKDLTLSWEPEEALKVIENDDNWKIRVSDLRERLSWFSDYCKKHNIDKEDYYSFYQEDNNDKENTSN